MKSTINKLKAGQIEELNVSNPSADNYVNNIDINTETGLITFSRTGELTDLTINLDSRYIKTIPSEYLTKTSADELYAKISHIHDEYKNNSSVRVISVDINSLVTPDKEGLLTYLRDNGFVKTGDETILIKTEGVYQPSVYTVTIITPEEGEYFMDTDEVNIAWEIGASFIDITEPVEGQESGHSIMINFELR